MLKKILKLYFWLILFLFGFKIKIIYEKDRSLLLNADVLWNNCNVPLDQIITRGMNIRFLKMSADERLILKDLDAKI